jgi:hypothetical protein
VGVAGRGVGRALLGSGLLAVTLLGGAGGYGLGLVTTDQQASAGTAAAPLPGDSSSTSPSTPPSTPTKYIVPDTTKPLQADDIHYKTREFTVSSVVESKVSMRVPGAWDMTVQDPPKYVRFNEPARKRWIRIEAGFSITRAPAASMAAKMAELKILPAGQMLTFKSQHIDPETKNATLVYTYVPEQSVRYVMVRWVANPEGLCIFEIAVTGLPQDKAALEDVLDHATDSAKRSDSPLS